MKYSEMLRWRFTRNIRARDMVGSRSRARSARNAAALTNLAAKLEMIEGVEIENGVIWGDLRPFVAAIRAGMESTD